MLMSFTQECLNEGGKMEEKLDNLSMMLVLAFSSVLSLWNQFLVFLPGFPHMLFPSK